MAAYFDLIPYTFESYMCDILTEIHDRPYLNFNHNDRTVDTPILFIKLRNGSFNFQLFE